MLDFCNSSSFFILFFAGGEKRIMFTGFVSKRGKLPTVGNRLKFFREVWFSDGNLGIICQRLTRGMHIALLWIHFGGSHKGRKILLKHFKDNHILLKQLWMSGCFTWLLTPPSFLCLCLDPFLPFMECSFQEIGGGGDQGRDNVIDNSGLLNQSNLLIGIYLLDLYPDFLPEGHQKQIKIHVYC